MLCRMHALEWCSALLNGGYALGLAYRKRWAWPLGFLGTLLAIAVMFEAKLYAESALNLAYAALALLGWFAWSPSERFALRAHRLRDASWAFGMAVGVSWVMRSLTDNPRPIWDAVLFSGGLLATWWQVCGDRWNWTLWLILNLAGIYVYADLGLEVYAAYSGMMALAAAWGWYRWGVR
ncbi:MAG: nicotinamide mononucleotide transporter [Bacteroidetes bacterium]|nr:nicotinamide mononucleotide transporter [Bacteroidota bacterium]